jgi:hypothetical protein
MNAHSTNVHLTDTKLVTLLEELRGISPPAYYNFNRNVEETYRFITAGSKKLPKRTLVNTALSDSGLLTRLQEIRTVSRADYVSLKTNLSAIYQSVIAEIMEKTFLRWRKNDSYQRYHVAPDMISLLADYVGITGGNIADAHMMVERDCKHAVIFVLNSDGFTTVPLHLYKRDDVFDTLQTFWEYLTPAFHDVSGEPIAEQDDGPENAPSDFDDRPYSEEDAL